MLNVTTAVTRSQHNIKLLSALKSGILVLEAPQTAVDVDPADPEVGVMWVVSGVDPSPSAVLPSIRPCRCRLRMESAIMRAVFF